MPLFLQILEGDTPSNARPVIATRDPEIIAVVAAALQRRLGRATPSMAAGAARALPHAPRRARK